MGCFAVEQLSSRSDLGRLESLGDNCELGFVLRRLGWEDGSLFRWSSIPPDCLLATLRGDFEDIYAFQNLVPCRKSMVRDLRYGTAWHSRMTSSPRGGEMIFDDDEPGRRAIHAGESAKRAHLVAKLRQKFDHPNPVFVIKHNPGIAEDVLEAIHYQLYRRVGSARFSLLEVQADEERAGTVEMVDRNRLRGYVSRFASYDRAEDGDDRSWHRVLARALTYDGEEEPSGLASRPAFHPIALPFPGHSEPGLEWKIAGDVRGGIGRLVRGNEWCRLLDDDVYRLHAREIGEAATALRWTGVHVPAGWRVCLQAACAIPESKPVRATLQVAGAEGELARCDHLFADTRTEAITLALPAQAASPVCVTLVVEPLEALRPGERAVVDLAPIEAVPHQLDGRHL